MFDRYLNEDVSKSFQTIHFALSRLIESWEFNHLSLIHRFANSFWCEKGMMEKIETNKRWKYAKESQMMAIYFGLNDE